MPAPKTRRPSYFGLIDRAAAQHHRSRSYGSRIATSTAISIASSVESSSALRKRGLAAVTCTALPRRSRRTEPRSSTSVRRKARGKLGALRQRQEHRVAEMGAGPRARQHMGDEDALVDLEAVLVALAQHGLVRASSLRRWRQVRGRRGGRDKLIESHEARHPPRRDLVIDGLRMNARGSARGLPRPPEDQRRRGGFGGVAPRLRRQRARPAPTSAARRRRSGSRSVREVGGPRRLRGEPSLARIGGRSRRRGGSR